MWGTHRPDRSLSSICYRRSKIDAIVALAMARVSAVEAFGLERLSPSPRNLPLVMMGPSRWQPEATLVDQYAYPAEARAASYGALGIRVEAGTARISSAIWRSSTSGLTRACSRQGLRGCGPGPVWAVCGTAIG